MMVLSIFFIDAVGTKPRAQIYTSYDPVIPLWEDIAMPRQSTMSSYILSIITTNYVLVNVNVSYRRESERCRRSGPMSTCSGDTRSLGQARGPVVEGQSYIPTR